MAPRHRSIARRSRNATSALRVVATLLALLLTASSLGQVAHFLLVPHAICAQHGELLELGEQEAHARTHANAKVSQGDQAADAAQTDAAQTRVSQAPSPAEHDHCQLLARGQRQQALPTPHGVELAPALGAVPTWVIAPQEPFFRALPALSLAPKTSPPAASLV